MNLGGEVKLTDVGPGPTLYRGWILKPADYERLAAAVAARGGELVTPPEQYRYACTLPDWYGDLMGFTPKSVWFPKENVNEELFSVLPTLLFNKFGGKGGLIVKDYLKSQKHYWNDACYIPDVRDGENVLRVVRRFLELQADSFFGGLVFRRYEPLKRIGAHLKSHMPLGNEWRFFFRDRRFFYAAPYWSSESGADYQGTAEPYMADVGALGLGVKSNFFALDLALTEEGNWIMIEVNDGGSAGVPEGGRVSDFYEALRDARGARC